MPSEQVVHYGRQLAEALAHAHERGVVHRDLKSNNVIVTDDRRVKVLDFGLAKRAVDSEMTAAVTQIHASLTQAGTAVGTLPYMSPEQLRGEQVGVSSDVWALGVVLYEMATGTRPFTGSTPFELSAAILSDAPIGIPEQIPEGYLPPSSTLPKAFERVSEDVTKKAGYRFVNVSNTSELDQALKLDP